ncbi:copper homeostasis protein CutC [Flavisolibacter ginsenosidimutans]|uniref:PF03932 family protein CutC n=1 Tax=Flavisolibacter ginsenosidimutans TaxID=661481 RepID=A0A5B8UD78_9BACT|nr:copper homeostasis protein CutC [Flavisolibacter ginsenosidimutans]QEC54433.1 copper homeostasis protein CutC [Flavisolibacter ginsenosidimutans]
MKYTVEVIAFNIESCAVIQQSGAHRIELCDNPHDGGTTASYGMIKAAREKVNIQLFPIIRPRGGDFLYNEDEFNIMKNDVQLCKGLCCDGVVLGLLQKDGSIDIKRTAELVELAYPMEVTFHRAFDRCCNPFETLEQLIEIGCQRILTSGQKPLATEGAELIAELIKAADDRIIIMPGSGVRPDNIKALAQKTGAVEFHSSLRTKAESKMEFHHPAFVGEADDASYVTTDAGAVRNLLQALND